MLIEGKIDVALSSKPITPELSQQAADKNVRLKWKTIARSSDAIVVHPSLPIEGITNTQFGKIKDGKINNWKQVGGPYLPISIYMTEGSYLGKNVPFTEVSDTTTTFRKVAEDPGGFTISPSNLAATQCRIKTLSIGVNSTNLVNPYYQQQGSSRSECDRKVNIDVIENFNYPLSSDLKVFFRDDDLGRAVGQAYISMLMTEDIQKLIEKAGYLPIKIK